MDLRSGAEALERLFFYFMGFHQKSSKSIKIALKSSFWRTTIWRKSALTDILDCFLHTSMAWAGLVWPRGVHQYRLWYIDRPQEWRRGLGRTVSRFYGFSSKIIKIHQNYSQELILKDHHMEKNCPLLPLRLLLTYPHGLSGLGMTPWVPQYRLW